MYKENGGCTPNEILSRRLSPSSMAMATTADQLKWREIRVSLVSRALVPATRFASRRDLLTFLSRVFPGWKRWKSSSTSTWTWPKQRRTSDCPKSSWNAFMPTGLSRERCVRVYSRQFRALSLRKLYDALLGMSGRIWWGSVLEYRHVPNLLCLLQKIL